MNDTTKELINSKLKTLDGALERVNQDVVYARNALKGALEEFYLVTKKIVELNETLLHEANMVPDANS